MCAASKVASIRSTAPTTKSLGKGNATKSSERPSKQCDKQRVAWKNQRQVTKVTGKDGWTTFKNIQQPVVDISYILIGS